MEDTNLIDICQAPLSLQYTSNIELIARSDTGVVIDSELHLSGMCKTSLLFTPLTVCVHAVCSAFLFYTLTKLLICLHIKYKIVLFLNYKLFFYI